MEEFFDLLDEVMKIIESYKVNHALRTTTVWENFPKFLSKASLFTIQLNNVFFWETIIMQIEIIFMSIEDSIDDLSDLGMKPLPANQLNSFIKMVNDWLLNFKQRIEVILDGEEKGKKVSKRVQRRK